MTRASVIDRLKAELVRIGPDFIAAEPDLAAAQILSVIAPPGEAWIAPWEATQAIRYAFAVEANNFAQDIGRGAGGCWSVIRDAHLKETGEGTR